MTLSSRTWTRLSRRDATVTTTDSRSRRTIRLVAVGIALAAGLAAPAATLADWDELESGQTANERSIALIEGADPANSTMLIAGDAEFRPVTANERSVAKIESKEAPGGVLAGGQPDFALTANERSIALIEGKEAPSGVLVITP